MRQLRCTGATQGSGNFQCQEWARSVPKGDGEVAVICINNIKNGADIQKILKQEKLVTFRLPELD